MFPFQFNILKRESEIIFHMKITLIATQLLIKVFECFEHIIEKWFIWSVFYTEVSYNYPLVLSVSRLLVLTEAFESLWNHYRLSKDVGKCSSIKLSSKNVFTNKTNIKITLSVAYVLRNTTEQTNLIWYKNHKYIKVERLRQLGSLFLTSIHKW